MAISTYAELVAQVLLQIGDDDDEGLIPNWIALAEAEIGPYLAAEALDDIVKEACTIDAEYETLPTGFLGFLRIVIGDPPRVLRAAPPGGMVYDTTGVPGFYAIVGGFIQVFPAPSSAQTGTWVYRKRLTALSSAAPSNWILTRSPNIYLHGTLRHAALHYRDEGMFTLHDGLFAAALEALRLEEWRRRWGEGPTEMIPAGTVV
jgi:hypothetical protein